ncbi:type II toxin-antitoxin system VapC family toxin [Cupriavidus pampae]|uniref:PIN domain-containing protein n=1 Tax=Cupriavidus pampae TaxID=659251 RepID=A0ABN7YDY6_9BURK|nr:type II toxin-antitoxin system VapC family toxin [Cupriavidus pampae]CAG9171138.1 hypothetical protein LMG32289_02261 [Cupriavidus pampae]
MYLADTNVLSEMMKSRPNPKVSAFFAELERNRESVYVSVLTFGEIQSGVKAACHRNDRARAIWLARNLRILRNRYRERTVGVDYRTCRTWAGLCVPSSHNAIDKLLAATAIERNFIVLTRNVRDFDRSKVKVVNPFDDVAALRRHKTCRPLPRQRTTVVDGSDSTSKHIPCARSTRRNNRTRFSPRFEGNSLTT